MRKILSLSLDNQAITKAKKQSARFGFNNVSQYVRHLINAQDELTSEEAILLAAKAARREYQTGQTIKADSLADLL